MNKTPDLINFSNFFSKDLSSCVVSFTEIIQSDIIGPFAPHKNELIYISVTRFTNILNKYNNLIKTSPPFFQTTEYELSEFSIFDEILNQDSKIEKEPTCFEKETTYYRKQIKSLYEEICGSNIV